MLKVGLTGGIGAGKSEVSRLLVSYGAVLVDADKIAREVVEPGAPGGDARVAAVGPGGRTARGRRGRPHLRGRVVAAAHQR
ncbi:dephospho-CoA kinase, partial [Streptomyces niveus]|uniref:dephospho-CoA kinase n=1 Tax=Streptomyces niveus TaxID=193462 RepID=UPI003682EB79